VLVIPTGGGKTFTASHFLCRSALSDGFKVLWLAHTHHLLEQAAGALNEVVGLVGGPRTQLNLRVVSGTPGHFKVASIRPTDDVVVSTLQTVANAVSRTHESFKAFLKSTGGRLVVVFDEAHHAPAPSYRKLLVGLRSRFPQLCLLGLTATPTHTDVRKLGWFHELFPQGILCEVSPHRLMAERILAKPRIVEVDTQVKPVFDEAAYRKWVGTNRDLPEEMIALLAKNQSRNDMIGQHYLDNRGQYGKTIIFADRWAQCEYLASWLNARGVRADAVYSHVDLTARTVDARKRRTADENAKVIARFRRNELDVLLNVRMLTEGTDVPDVKTVFLTRQTTSTILLTQMVGRALRGPRFGGTDEAFLVSFIDQWRHRINWAGFDQFTAAELDESGPASAERPPLHLISIELVRRLARQMDAGPGAESTAVSLLPLGWYRVEYDARDADSDDVESVSGFVVVFSDERNQFTRFVSDLQSADLDGFEDETVELDDVRDQINTWAATYFPDGLPRIGGALDHDLFRLARHTAHNDGVPPVFFAFESRNSHDLDAVAARFLSADYTRAQEDRELRTEYDRQDRFWTALYRTYAEFIAHFDACVRRTQARQHHGSLSTAPYSTPEAIQIPEPDDTLKEMVRTRDGFRCLCCGRGKPRVRLQVDHITSSYHGGVPVLDNLQTLCSSCNNAKGVERINYRVNTTPLTSAPSGIALVGVPTRANARNREDWQACLRGSINRFYRCAAVARVEVGARGEYLRNWSVELFPGNDPSWLSPHYHLMLDEIRETRRDADLEAAPDRITFS
jgi:superfamily II DNA or RNA helicase